MARNDVHEIGKLDPEYIEVEEFGLRLDLKLIGHSHVYKNW